jgi:hypothetical protein
MATQNNKNISYSKYDDLFKRQQVTINVSNKNSILTKISLFVSAVKQKHS